MSCSGCGNKAPSCGCAPKMTKCDLNRSNNVWVEKGTGGENCIGICLLDTMTEEQVVNVLERDERARADLLKVTSDERLRHLAMTTKRLPTAEEADLHQKWVNRNEAPASIPFYGLFRGQPPFAQ